MIKIFFLLLILVIPRFCFAANYELSDLDIRLDIPDEYIVITQQTSNDHNFEKLGLSKNEFINKLKEKNIALYAVNYTKGISIEIHFRNSNDEEKEYWNKLTPEMVKSNKFQSDAESRSKAWGLKLSEAALYEVNKIKFMCFKKETNEDNYIDYFYTTLLSDKVILFVGESSSNDFDVLKLDMEKILNSIRPLEAEMIISNNDNNKISNKYYLYLIGLAVFFRILWNVIKNNKQK
jgi:hypothetical protein